MMQAQSTWFTDFCETAQDLRQDVVLLEAMALRLEESGGLTWASRDEVFQTLWRALDYLSQHAADLGSLARRLEEVSGPPTPAG